MILWVIVFFVNSTGSPTGISDVPFPSLIFFCSAMTAAFSA